METTPPNRSPESPNDYVVLDLVAFLSIIWRRKYFIVGMGVLGFAVALGLSYTRPKLYEATLRFKPPVRAALPFVLSIGRSTGDEYRAMLSSNIIADDVVAHQDLVRVFHAKDAKRARLILMGMTKFSIDSNNFISIVCTSTDPKLAASVANEFYAALYRKEDTTAADEARHRLNFMSAPLEQERARLFAAEDALRDAQQKTGLVLPGAQGTLGVQQVASLRGRVSDLQAQLAVARVGSTDQNPRVITLQSQIANLQGQIERLQGQSTQSDAPGRLPGMALEVERREREVRFHVSTLESLTKALETSQMADSYTPNFVVVDPAELPTSKISPSRSKWALVGAFLFGVSGLLWALGSGLILRWLATPHGARTMARWKQSWRNPDPRAGNAA